MVDEVESGVDAVGVKELRATAADAPDIFDGGGFKNTVNSLWCGHGECVLEGGIAFGLVVGEFGKSFGGGDTDAGGDAGGAFDELDDGAGFFFGTDGIEVFKEDEGFVDGVDFDVLEVFFDEAHDTFGDVAVEGEVGGEAFDVCAVDDVFYFKEWGAHGDAEGFGFVGAGDDAAIVIGEDDDGMVLQVRVEEPFAGYEEVVAVYESEEWHGLMVWMV